MGMKKKKKKKNLKQMKGEGEESERWSEGAGALRGSHLVRQQLVHGLGRHAGRLQLLAGLGGSLALHQRLGLGQEVGHQDLRGASGRVRSAL